MDDFSIEIDDDLFIDYDRLLSITINLNRFLIDKLFFRDIYFYWFPKSIDFNQRIKSINTHDIDWLPISTFND